MDCDAIGSTVTAPRVERLLRGSLARPATDGTQCTPSSSVRAVTTARLDDVIALGVLLAAVVVVTLGMVLPLQSYIRGDWPAFFLPNYAFLGDRLRALDIPGWNPYQFSGTPFAGDPESGWGYLPAMAIYAIFPAEPATLVYVAFHIAFAVVAIYVLCRLLGLSVVGSFVAATAYGLAWVAIANGQLVIWTPVSSWTIVALAGVELTANAVPWSSRIWGLLIVGLAISQVLAVWMGQGALYTLITIACWIGYRTLLPRNMPLHGRSAAPTLCSPPGVSPSPRWASRRLSCCRALT